MDLGIKELGVTLAIGAFTILGLTRSCTTSGLGIHGFFEGGLRAQKRREERKRCRRQ